MVPTKPPTGDRRPVVALRSAALYFVHAAEADLLLDGDPFDPDRVERHVQDLVAALLPGLDRGA